MKWLLQKILLTFLAISYVGSAPSRLQLQQEDEDTGSDMEFASLVCEEVKSELPSLNP
jgi:hypothetical protein